MALKLKGRIKREHRQACSYSTLITAGWTDKSERRGEGETHREERVWVSAGEVKWRATKGRHITSLHRDLKEVEFWVIKSGDAAWWGWRVTVTAPKKLNAVRMWFHFETTCSLDLISLSRGDLEHVSEITQFTGFVPDWWLFSSLKQKLQTGAKSLGCPWHDVEYLQVYSQ